MEWEKAMKIIKWWDYTKLCNCWVTRSLNWTHPLWKRDPCNSMPCRMDFGMINDDSNHKLRYNANKWQLLSRASTEHSFSTSGSQTSENRRRKAKLMIHPLKTMNNGSELSWQHSPAISWYPFDDERFHFGCLSSRWMCDMEYVSERKSLNWYKVNRKWQQASSSYDNRAESSINWSLNCINIACIESLPHHPSSERMPSESHRMIIDSDAGSSEELNQDRDASRCLPKCARLSENCQTILWKW